MTPLPKVDEEKLNECAVADADEPPRERDANGLTGDSFESLFRASGCAVLDTADEMDMSVAEIELFGLNTAPQSLSRIILPNIFPSVGLSPLVQGSD
jgi:hypothetical protein